MLVHKGQEFCFSKFLRRAGFRFRVAQLFYVNLLFFLYKREKFIFFVFKRIDFEPSCIFKYSPGGVKRLFLNLQVKVGFFENCCRHKVCQEMSCNKVINFSRLRNIHCRTYFSSCSRPDWVDRRVVVCVFFSVFRYYRGREN
ncbi:hypothetical protein SDC9_207326 [bioreactor metagenome]|uniref:Uncharacterized protein n=1 Tax=bioreactor metagenome TaxID=1076179 RepID=A0A645J7B2_9ZZZZ